jgi:hypothetical protein
MAASKVQPAARPQKLARVEKRSPRLSDRVRHRVRLLPVSLGQFATTTDRFGELPPPGVDLRGPFLRGPRRRRNGVGGARARPFARDAAAAEGGDIAAARHLDNQRVVATHARIITGQCLTHAHGFDADDGVGLRIKIGPATERFHGNRIGLELAAVTRQGCFDKRTESWSNGRNRGTCCFERSG